MRLLYEILFKVKYRTKYLASVQFSLWALLFPSPSIGGIEAQVKREIVLVSLGSHCEVANLLRSCDLREFATPVDWMLTLNHRGFIRLLKANFSGMFDPQYLFQHPEGYVTNSRYKIDFRHDWPGPGLKQYLPEVKEKYERRIDRFFTLHQITRRIVFIRTAYDHKLNVANNMPYYSRYARTITQKQAQELYAVLKEKFYSTPFLLVIINYQEEKIGTISGIPNVLEFKVSKKKKRKSYLKFINLLADPSYFDAHYINE